MKKGKKINYFSFNKGTLVLIILLILFLLNTFYERVFLGGATNFSICLELFSFVLMYVGLVWHLVLIDNKIFLKTWNYIKDSKKFIYSAVGVFFAFVLIGFFVPAPAFVVEQITQLIEDILARTEGLSNLGLIRFILFNNVKSSFFGMVFGIFFGFFPVFVALMNGYVLGFVAEMSVSRAGAGSLFLLVPHGIFELPAIFLSLAMGIKLGTWIFKKDKKRFFREDVLRILIVFLLVVIPLLIIAAIIEGSLMPVN